MIAHWLMMGFREWISVLLSPFLSLFPLFFTRFILPSRQQNPVPHSWRHSHKTTSSTRKLTHPPPTEKTNTAKNTTPCHGCTSKGTPRPCTSTGGASTSPPSPSTPSKPSTPGCASGGTRRRSCWRSMSGRGGSRPSWMSMWTRRSG